MATKPCNEAQKAYSEGPESYNEARQILQCQMFNQRPYHVEKTNLATSVCMETYSSPRDTSETTCHDWLTSV